MKPNKITKIAITGATAAALCLGMASPALAHQSIETTSSAAYTDRDFVYRAPTLTQTQTWIDNFVTNKVTKLDAFAARVAADPKLTAAQKAAFATKVAQIRQNLLSLKAAVDAATSVQQVQAILAAAFPQAVWPAWPRHLHHRVTAAAFTRHRNVSSFGFDSRRVGFRGDRRGWDPSGPCWHGGAFGGGFGDRTAGFGQHSHH